MGGPQFNVHNTGTSELITIKVLKAELVYDIIRLHTAVLDEPDCEVDELIDMFTGFSQSPYHITWYTTDEPREAISRAVMQAAAEGNELCVLELIPKADPEDK